MRKVCGWVCAVGTFGLLLFTGCTQLLPANVLPGSATEDNVTTGIATYLSDEFDGQATASGVPYDKDAMVAAHASLPFDTSVLVTNLATGATVTVVIVDRMPERVESIIDVSSAAAAALGMLESGEADVSIDIVD